MTAAQDVRPADSDGRRQLLQDNWHQFEALVGDCERELERGRYERAAARAQVAATYAWFNHPGTFTSQRLERVLTRLGAELGNDRAAEPREGGLLHVASRLHQTGGHTQMIANWMTTDTGHTHRLCVTHQAAVPVPDKVRTSLPEGDTVHLLDDEAAGFLARGRALRRLARSADVIVLHVHPNDVVASIALADPTLGRPVLLVNHADHVFWVGTSVTTTVVNLRHSGEQHTVERRGVPPERNAVLIRPLLLRGREHERAQARRLLGLPEDRVLLVTAAAGSKYEPAGGCGFLDLLEPVLADRPEAFLVAGGPEPVGRWQQLEDSGRGRALGLLPDARPLLEAADVYVDSFPFSSLTSLLEAGSLGTPVVTVRPPTGGADVLGADTPELVEDLIVAHDPAELRRVLGELVLDAGHRARVGAATGAAIQDAHANDEWARQVALLCRDAVPGGPFPPSGPDFADWGVLDQRVALVQQRTGIAQGLLGTWAVNAGYLTWGERLGLVVALVRRGRQPSPGMFLPVRWSRRLRRLRKGSAAWAEKWRARAG